MKTLLFDPPTESAAAIPSLSSVLPLGTRVKDGDNNGYIYCLNGMNRTAQAGDVVYITPDYKFKSVPDDNSDYKTGIILPILITDKETYFGPIPQKCCCLVQLYVPGLPVPGGAGEGTVTSVNNQLPDAGGAVTVTAAQITYTPVNETGGKKDDLEDVDTAIDNNTILLYKLQRELDEKPDMEDLDSKAPKLYYGDGIETGTLADLCNLGGTADGPKIIATDPFNPPGYKWNDTWKALLNVPVEDTYITIEQTGTQRIYFLDVICRQTSAPGAEPLGYTLQLCWTLYEDYESQQGPNPPFFEALISVPGDEAGQPVTVNITKNNPQIIASSRDSITAPDEQPNLYNYFYCKTGIDIGTNYNNIEQNASAIQQNAAKIQKNTAAIQQNAHDIEFKSSGYLIYNPVSDIINGKVTTPMFNRMALKIVKTVAGVGVDPTSPTQEDFAQMITMKNAGFKIGYYHLTSGGVTFDTAVSITCNCDDSMQFTITYQLLPYLNPVVLFFSRKIGYADDTGYGWLGQPAVDKTPYLTDDLGVHTELAILPFTGSEGYNFDWILGAAPIDPKENYDLITQKSDIYSGFVNYDDTNVFEDTFTYGFGVDIGKDRQEDFAVMVSLTDAVSLTMQRVSDGVNVRALECQYVPVDDNNGTFTVTYNLLDQTPVQKNTIFSQTITKDSSGNYSFTGTAAVDLLPFKTTDIGADFKIINSSSLTNDEWGFLIIGSIPKADCEYNFKQGFANTNEVSNLRNDLNDTMSKVTNLRNDLNDTMSTVDANVENITDITNTLFTTNQQVGTNTSSIIQNTTDISGLKSDMNAVVKSVNNTQPDSNGNVVVHTGGDKIFKWNSAFGQAPGALVSVHISELSAASFSATGDEYDMGATVFDINYSLGKVTSYSSDHTQLMVLVLTQNQTSATEIKK